MNDFARCYVEFYWKESIYLLLLNLCLHYGLALVAGACVFYSVSDDMIKTTLLVTWMFPVGVAIISYGIQFKYRTLPFIGMTTNLTIIISIIILYVYQAVFV